MRSGLREYDDFDLFQWTIQHPDADYLPKDFVANVNKTFLFEPGTGGCYSSTGYVVVGWVLAAVTGADAGLKPSEVISSDQNDPHSSPSQRPSRSH